ncbi:MAG TPA: glycosyltransferase family 39 protein, partial [Candidatus Brocadiia bacterium]|nr:glycosyltransferase family 39 protein [Candidatus Brocadiia bacterium]
MFGDESCVTIANITRFFRERTILPEDTIYPTLYSYIEAAALGVWSVYQIIAGHAASLAGAGILFITGQAPLIEPLRVVTVAFDTATVFLAFLLGRRLRDPATGIAAAAFVALSQNHLSYARWALPDVPMAFFSTACLLLALRHLEAPSWRRLLGSAALAGLATSCKYNGAMITLAVAAAHLLAQPPRGRAISVRWLSQLAAAAVVCVAAFAAGSPAWIIQPRVMLATFRQTSAHMAAGHYFVPGGPPYVWVLNYLLSAETSIGAAGLLGIIWACLARERRLWVIVTPVIAAIAVIGLWNKQSPYYLLGVWPALLALGAVAVHDFVRWFSLRPLALASAVALLVALPAANAAQLAWDELRTDNRRAAERWIQARLPAGAKVGTDVMAMPNLYDRLWINEAGARRASQLTHEADMAIWTRFVKGVRAYDLSPMPVDNPAWLDSADVDYAVTS